MKRTVFATLLTALLALTTAAHVTADSEKVGLCHRTASDSHPYTYVVVDRQSLPAHLNNLPGHPAKVNADGSPRNDYLAASAAECEAPSSEPSATPQPTAAASAEPSAEPSASSSPSARPTMSSSEPSSSPSLTASSPQPSASVPMPTSPQPSASPPQPTLSPPMPQPTLPPTDTDPTGRGNWPPLWMLIGLAMLWLRTRPAGETK